MSPAFVRGRSEVGRSTRAARDRARASDRRPGGVAAGTFAICLGGAALWAHRVGASVVGADSGWATGLVVFGVAAVVLYAVVIRLDLSRQTSELSGRLSLECRLARRFAAAADVDLVLHDRQVDGSAPLSHVVLTPSGVDVIVDASPVTWAPWRPGVDLEAASSTCLWRAWVDASTGAEALRHALEMDGLVDAASLVEPVVVTDAATLPEWASGLPLLPADHVPRGRERSVGPAQASALVSRLPDLATPAAPC